MNRGKSKRAHQADRPFSAAMDVDGRRRWRPSLRFVLLCAMILIVAGGIVGLSLSLPEKKARTAGPVGVPAFGPTGVPAPVAPFGATRSTPKVNPGIPNPTPWQYDPVTNQHWVPTAGHLHWHSGPPPANPDAVSPAAFDLGAIQGTTNVQAGNPDIPDPQPWQYNPVTNQHWNPLPGHEHWHSGTAPPPGQRQ